MFRSTLRGRITAAVTALAAAFALAPAPGAAHADASGYSALVSADCTDGRLQLVLDNQSASSATFDVSWSGRSGSPWSRTVAAGGNALLYWTIADGTAYSLTTTTPGWSNAQSGTMDCGLGSGTPQMDQTALLTTSTVIDGLNGADGLYDGTVASVRIPALAVTNDGTIVMTADARVSSSADLPDNIQIVMRRSTDGGATWTTPEIIEHAPTTSEGTGDSSLLVDRATGRLNATTDTESLHVEYISSDDNGATWHTGGSAGENVNESKAIERSTGTVVQDMRANAGGFRYDAASTDEGATFGTDASNGLIDPGCNADEISYLEPADVSSTTGAPPTTADALFSNSMNSSSRVDLTVRYSTDDGATWPYAALLVPGTAGYSTMGVLGDGTVADLYEVGDTGGIFVDHFTLAWLEAA